MENDLIFPVAVSLLQETMTNFSTLDANSGFWQTGLSPESAKLTTFITPFGRFCFNRLPFVISSAPKQFQKWILQVLEGTDVALCQIDDNLLVFDKMTEELDNHLEETPHKLQEANLTLNEETCEFFKSSVEHLASIVDSEGVRVEHKKVEAVMETPKDQSATKSQAFYATERPPEFKRPLVMGWRQQQTFSALKHFSSLRCRSANNPLKWHILWPTSIQKQDNDGWCSVAYASRATSPTEQPYA